MMPKGVDHRCGSETLGWLTAVQKSLMPKGVDHSPVWWCGGTGVTVQKSLMPKGVDHIKTRDKEVLDAVCKNL